MENTSGSVFINQYLEVFIYRSLAFGWIGCTTAGDIRNDIRSIVRSGQAALAGVYSEAVFRQRMTK